MGRTKQSKQVQQGMFDQLHGSQQRWNDYNARFNPLISDARNRATGVYNQTKDYYTNFLSGFNNPMYSKQDFEVSPENTARIRGNGVFDEFAKTGGLSEADKGLFRAQGTATLGSFYDNFRNEMAASRARSGGVDPGYDAQTAKLARDQAQGAQTAATNTEANILDRVTQGRQWGASSLSDAEKALVSAIFQGRGMGAQYEQGNKTLQLQGMQGLQHLYSDAPGEVSMYENLLANGLQNRDSSSLSALDMLAQYTPNGNWFDRNRRLLGVLGGIASAFFPAVAPVAKAVASGSDTSYTGGYSGAARAAGSETYDSRGNPTGDQSIKPLPGFGGGIFDSRGRYIGE